MVLSSRLAGNAELESIEMACDPADLYYLLGFSGFSIQVDEIKNLLRQKRLKNADYVSVRINFMRLKYDDYAFACISFD